MHRAAHRDKATLVRGGEWNEQELDKLEAV